MGFNPRPRERRPCLFYINFLLRLRRRDIRGGNAARRTAAVTAVLYIRT